jgi:VWFA-related protein
MKHFLEDIGEAHMRTVFRLSVSFFLSLFALTQQGIVTPAYGQAQPALPSSTTPPATDHRISLDVVVTDKAGNAVSGLTEQDFTLLDDKQPRKITSFRAPDATSATPAPPLQVIFVIDAVNTGVQSVNYGRMQLSNFLKQDGGRLSDPTSLVIFTDTGTRIQPTPTRDGNALAESLDSNHTGLRVLTRSGGFYGAQERLDLSLKAIDQLASYERTQPGKKLVVWMSPGWPMLSGPNVELTAKSEQWLFQTIVTMSRELREAGITLYSIDPLGMNDAGGFRTFYYESFLKGVPSYNKVQAGNLALQVLAAQSGGLVMNSNNNIEKEVAECLKDAKGFYTLSFDSPPADHPNEYHSLEVKVDKPGLKARTRTGYYAEPYETTGR